MNKDYLFKFLHGIHPLHPKTREKIESFLKPISVPAKQFILREGNVSGRVIFITKGLVRAYYIKNGVEVTTWLMTEGDVIFSIESFLMQQPAHEYIQCCEDFEGYYITYEQLQYLYKYHIEFNIIGRVLIEKYYMLSERRNTCIRMRSAPERYEYLLAFHSHLLLRAANKYLASFVGLRPETLSRRKRRKY